ncbi:MAG: peptidase S10 [Alphaproteobacteria bacterium]|nr:MAG: peptidase S10 [Alphaproteobacteria bacterium]
MTERRFSVLLATLLLAFTAPALADGIDPAFDGVPVVSSHSVELATGTLGYVAEAGRVAIRDAETGAARGQMGYFAYRVPAPKGTGRPLMFIWNGGPGSNSAILHFEVAGPRRASGGQLSENAETWLAYADLVFVDPIGTGFSRPTAPEYAAEFYGTVGDVASVAEFVRAWRLLHGAEDAPLYLAGESWGAGRAGSVGYTLLKQGLPVKGLVLISGGAGLNEPVIAPSLRTALKVPDLALVAHYHGKLDPVFGTDATEVLARAEDWARRVYRPALENKAGLSAEARSALADELARRIGIAADMVDADSLTISPRAYREGLLKAEGLKLDTFDMRLTGQDEENAAPAIERYIRHDLGFATSLAYVGLGGADAGYAPDGRFPASVGARWNYATAKLSEAEIKAAIDKAIRDGGGPPRLGPPLPSVAEALDIAPGLKVLVVAGSFDSLNSCTGNAAIAAALPAPLKTAMSFRCYTGGHMFYRDQPSRFQFSKDIEAFLQP